MINYEHYDLFQQGSTDKQWEIECENKIKIKNENLFSESIELTESLCSENELRFGCCESSSLKFKVANIVSTLKGGWLTAELILGHKNNPFAVGRYKVDSDKLTADKQWREIVAYDAMYDIINADVADWYNSILPNDDSVITVNQFRTSFIHNFGLEQEEVELVNDDMEIKKTIWPSQLSGKDVITAICEINGCFGHIGRDGKFHYIYLAQYMQGVYPADDLFPSDDLFPAESKSIRVGQNRSYKSCQYEDYVTREINRLQIRQNQDDVGTVYPEGELSGNDNCYIIENNFLVYGKEAEELKRIAANIFGKISGISYRPFSVELRGNPCFEAGDAISISTKYEVVETYILKRTMKGIQAIMDNLSSDGIEKYAERVNSVNSSIVQLKGKTNELVRTVEETRSTLTDVEEGLQTEIIQRADAIEAEAKARNELGEEIKANFVVKVTEDGENGVVAEINGTADKIHFGANNMFTVDSPNFSVDDEGNLKIIGKIIMRSRIGNARPPQYIDFVFAEADADENGNPYLYIKSPDGTIMMECGEKSYFPKPSNMKPYMVQTPIFNNGIYAENTVIASLFEDYKYHPNISNGSESVTLHTRASGVFVSVYGSYHAFEHKAGEVKTIVIGDGSERYCPTHQAVRAVGFLGKRMLVFSITTDGKMNIRNVSDTDISQKDLTDINFRFDFFRF